MSASDRGDAASSLLFGLLAFQNNLISRLALLNAMEGWMADKSRAIGQILVDQGAITDEMRAMLEALVAAHLTKHGGEPEKSLAALTPLSSGVRKDLLAMADIVLGETLSVVSNGVDQEVPDTITLPVGSQAVGTPSSAGVRFQILRPLSQGGMGVVSVARDTELDRTIALKEIRDSAADNNDYRARFLAEAEITGKLEHPGIIPIYGLGTYADGRPFYAMRLIRGDKTGSLMDAIKRFHAATDPDASARVVAFRGLLGRFLDVCNAVSYAHSKGVLHRDLKPDNILLGPYGETLVVDWGLAKAAGREEIATVDEGEQVRLNLSGSHLSPTMAGGAFGTPGYAPPEQMTGDLANISPRSDVYGLGAVLYCLMTGQPPFSRKGMELAGLIEKITAGDMAPPRQIRPDLDRPLEAICLKAMSTKPDDRYATVRDLAIDIERYLADESITAYREPWTVRARRWTKKRRTLVTSAAAALIVAAVGLAAVSVVQTKARNDLALKNIDLDKQRQRAEERESQAIAAVKRFGDVVRETRELRNDPTLEPLRKKLLGEPIAFLRILRKSLQSDNDTRSQSLSRLADASFELGTLTSEIGDQQDALTAYRESLAIRRQLADDNPAIPEYQRAQAQTHLNIGNLLAASGRPNEAFLEYAAAQKIATSLTSAHPDDVGSLSDLAMIFNNKGSLLRTNGKPDEALKAQQDALAIRKRVADSNLNVIEFQNQLAQSYQNLGNIQSDLGKVADAIQSYNSALKITKALVKADPENTEHQAQLAKSLYSFAGILWETGKSAEALKAHESSRAILEPLAKAHPSVIEYQHDLARTHNAIGVLQKGSGLLADALKSYGSALKIQQKLADANPSITRFQSDVANSHYNIGLLHWASENPDAALISYRAALNIQQHLADANPDNTDMQASLAATHNNIANPLWTAGKKAEAVKEFEAASAILGTLAHRHPDSHLFASHYASSLSNLAETDIDAGHFEKAQTLLNQAIKWHRKALSFYPDHPAYRRYLVDNLENLIEAAQGLGDVAGEAEARRELETLRGPDPATTAADNRLAAILAGQGSAKDSAERLQLAQRAYQKLLHAMAARLWAEALADDPHLGDDRQAQIRYKAACAACQAGSGLGVDVPRPDEAAKVKLRAQAMAWLKDELIAWKQVSLTAGSGNKARVASVLAHWKVESDLAGVHDPASLEKLPSDERQEWQALWNDVDALIAKMPRSD